MESHSEFYTQFVLVWWLVLPLLGLGMGLVASLAQDLERKWGFM